MAEQLEYNGVKIPIIRESCAEVYAALKPPEALPYIVAPKNMEAAQIVEFFKAHVDQLAELQEKMRKRFAKSKSEKCGYQTGDIAYVMGRPFMIQVHPLNRGKNVGKGVRGRVSVKYNVDIEVSLLQLFVVQAHKVEQSKAAFMAYARNIVLKNAVTMAKVCFQRIAPGVEPPQVRMRAMKERFVRYDGKVLWLSEDIVPYPVDCLAYAVWEGLLPQATLPEEQAQEEFHKVLPGWQRAGDILNTRAKPYSNQ